MALTAIDPNPALVVIDLQKGLTAVPTAQPIAEIVQRPPASPRRSAATACPWCWSTRAAGPPGAPRPAPGLADRPLAPDWTDIVPELDPQPGDLRVTKQRWAPSPGPRSTPSSTTSGSPRSSDRRDDQRRGRVDRALGPRARLPRGARHRRDDRSRPGHAPPQRRADLPSDRREPRPRKSWTCSRKPANGSGRTRRAGPWPSAAAGGPGRRGRGPVQGRWRRAPRGRRRIRDLPEGASQIGHRRDEFAALLRGQVRQDPVDQASRVADGPERSELVARTPSGETLRSRLSAVCGSGRRAAAGRRTARHDVGDHCRRAGPGRGSPGRRGRVRRAAPAPVTPRLRRQLQEDLLAGLEVAQQRDLWMPTCSAISARLRLRTPCRSARSRAASRMASWRCCFCSGRRARWKVSLAATRRHQPARRRLCHQGGAPGPARQGSGRIIQVSSIGGRLATPGLSAYQAAKWAVGGFSEVLAKETEPLGIKVTVLEPGGMATDWAGSSMHVPPVSEPYRTTVGAMARLHHEGDSPPALGDPAKVAQVVLAVADMDEPPLRLILGSEAYAYATAAARARAESDVELARPHRLHRPRRRHRRRPRPPGNQGITSHGCCRTVVRVLAHAEPSTANLAADARSASVSRTLT